MSLIRKHGAVLQAWACLDLVYMVSGLGANHQSFNTDIISISTANLGISNATATRTNNLALNPYRVVTDRQTDTDRIPIANTRSQYYLPVQLSRVKTIWRENIHLCFKTDGLSTNVYSQYFEEQENFGQSLAWWPAGESVRQVFRMAMGLRFTRILILYLKVISAVGYICTGLTLFLNHSVWALYFSQFLL